MPKFPTTIEQFVRGRLMLGDPLALARHGLADGLFVQSMDEELVLFVGER
ncbi:MAG: hypothetical protein ACXWC8_22285 [Limisphaerales bacterium]